MKAGILYADREIRVGDAPEPVIRADEVLVQSSFAGICGTDLHIYRGEFHDRVKFPSIQGHEFGGTVAAIGSQVKNLKAGDRVVV
jgi:D-arabinose 1-dehydrogenase-like Zn-dependent alcohol dehydrogenase